MNIPPEKDTGCIEYKWKLLNIDKYKSIKLSSQMMWRVREGKKSALYVIGVHDNGNITGLTKQEFIETYLNLLDCALKMNLYLCIKYIKKVKYKENMVWAILQIFKSKISKKSIKFDYDIPKIPEHKVPKYLDF
jgi:GTPase